MSQQQVCDFHEAELLSRFLPLAGTVSFCGHATRCVMLQCFQVKSQTANRKHWVMIIPCHSLPSRAREIGWSEVAQTTLKYCRMSIIWNNTEHLFWLFEQLEILAPSFIYQPKRCNKNIGEAGTSGNI